MTLRTRARRRTLAAGTAVVIASLTSACTGGSHHAATSASTTGTAAPRVVWTSASPQPMGQPKAAGSAVVVYAVADGIPSVESIDAKSGRVLWSKQVEYPSQTPGVPEGPLVVGKTVIYVARDPADASAGHLVVADLLSGNSVATTAAEYTIEQPPTSCDKAVCFSALAADNTAQNLKMDLATGSVDVDTSQASGMPGSRSLGSDGLLSIQLDGKPETIGREVERCADVEPSGLGGVRRRLLLQRRLAVQL